MTPHGSPIYANLKTNLSTYNTILKKIIRRAKAAYYESTCNLHKHDTRKTWTTINQIISKSVKSTTRPSYFVDNNKTITDKQEIANKFNNLFTNIGPNHARAVLRAKSELFHITSQLMFCWITKWRGVPRMPRVQQLSTHKMAS